MLFLVNTSLTGLDMNPNVNPPLKPGQLYLLDGGFSTQLSKYLGAEKVDVESLRKIIVIIIRLSVSLHINSPVSFFSTKITFFYLFRLRTLQPITNSFHIERLLVCISSINLFSK